MSEPSDNSANDIFLFWWSMAGPIVGGFVVFFFKRWHIRYQKFIDVSGEFRSKFTDTLQQLENGDTTLNVLILQDFPKHDAAFKGIIHYFRGHRKKRINKKWKEYEKMYYKLKNIPMPFSLGMAIAPEGESIINRTPEEIKNWEFQRSQTMYNIIHDLLNLTSKNRWF